MAYDEQLANRIRKVLAKRKGVTAKKMFGGLTFLLRGHMCCGVSNTDLVLRLGPDQAKAALDTAYTRPFAVTGRPLKGMVMVGPSGYKTDEALREWVQRAVDFVLGLPAKETADRKMARQFEEESRKVKGQCQNEKA